MKKKSVKKKYPSIKKNSTFRALWDYYRRVQKDFLRAVKRHQETKKTYEALKAGKGTATGQIKAWKKELKRAKKNKQLMREIIKDARRHVKRWLKTYHALYDLADQRASLKKEKPTEKKKAAPKKAVKKVADKPTKAKKKETPKPVKKTKTKLKKKVVKKAKPEAKVKLVVAKKLTPARKPKLKPATPAATKAKPIVKPKTARKPVVRKTIRQAAPAAKKRATTRPDNLKRVEGIGVKIEQLLQGAGIDSFDKLSKTALKTLRGHLDKAGQHYRKSDPTTWPKQAGLAAKAKWSDLKKWQSELKGGKVVK